jgi:hypothetical protein
LLAATSATPSWRTISSICRVAGPVSFFAEDATVQISADVPVELGD